MKLLQFEGHESPEMWINPEHVSALVPHHQQGTIVIVSGGKTIHLKDSPGDIANRILREQ
jgi:hypothetical protein